MQRKVKPCDVGCGRPYVLSYCTRLKIEKPEHAELLSQFIRRYRSACLALYKLVRRLFQNPKNHLALYAIFLPSRVPVEVQRTWFWSENIKGHPLDVQGKFDRPGRRWGDPARASAKPKVWSDLNVDATYALLAILAEPATGAPSTWPARVFQQMIKEYGLSCCGLQSKSLKWIFRYIPDTETRRRVGESVASLVRSLLSTKERVREVACERGLALKSLEAEYPALFGELRAYVEDMRSWQEACRGLQNVRKEKQQELRDSGIENEQVRSILWATQREAMRKAADKVPSWGRIQPATLEEQQLALQHAEIVEYFVNAICREDRPRVIDEFPFRRFASQDLPPIRLANEPDHLSRIIDAYSRHVASLSEELSSVLALCRKVGRRTVHLGWETICRALAQRGNKDRATGSAEANALHNFVTGKVRLWFRSLRPVGEVEWPEQPEFWPTLLEGADWERLRAGKTPWGNSLQVQLRIRGRYRKISVIANLRGHLPPAKARDIEPLDVANGLSRFTPNQALSGIARDQKQITYLKLQAMRLMEVEGKFVAKISATQMTQLLGAPAALINPADAIRPGERLAVLQLYPGGRRFGQLVLFERYEDFPDWKQVPIKEIIPDTRAESYEERNGNRVHVRTQRKLTTSFVVFDETSYFLRSARLEKFTRRRPSEPNGACASRPESGPRANLGDIHYRQLSARIASLCRYNRIGYLLIAGTGRLSASIKFKGGASPLFLTAPTKKFLTVRQSGTYRQLEGVLINALQKAGVITFSASARARNFWVKPYLQQRTLAGCEPARPYREEAEAESGRIYTGKRTLIAPDDRTPGYPYPLSACWALLLDWSRPEFSKHVARTLWPRFRTLDSEYF